jgi:hypothetical protein
MKAFHSPFRYALRALAVSLMPLTAACMTAPEGVSSEQPDAGADVLTDKNGATNLALAGTASQSSLAYRGDPARAIDGNTSGRWSDSSVTHTAQTSTPWWRVDLGGAHRVDRVTLWNRTDCCSSRLSNFHVDYLDAEGKVIVSREHPGQAAPTTEIALSARGVHAVRVQLNGSNFLSLAEVQVWGALDTAPEEGPNDGEAEPGLSFAHYRLGSLSRLPDFNTLSPSETGVVPTVSVARYAGTDYFGVVLSGSIRVDAEGRYDFELGSDDGSKLEIDGQLVVNNDGLHGFRTVTGTAELSEGYHPIRIEFFERNGGERLSLRYRPTGGAFTEVPTSVLFTSTPTPDGDAGTEEPGEDAGTEEPGEDAGTEEPGDQGTVTVSDGSQNIRQVTQRFEFPGHIAPTKRWTQRTNGLCGNTCKNGPRHMYSAAFNDTLLVSWMAVDEADPWKQYGNVATFKVDNSGKFTFVKNVSFKGMCEATYGISTNHDGSVIAVLCRGETGSTTILPGAINLLGTRRNASSCNGSWEGTCYPIGNYSSNDSALYVLEYTGGQVTEKPNSTVYVNHAVGGWNYGHHELMLNEAEDTYFVHLKVTAGPSATNRHEGLTHFGLRRKPSFEYVRLTDWNGWACGGGHVLANRMAYNQHQDSWSKLCMLDLCPNRSQYANGRCNSISFNTVPGVTKPQVGTYELEYLLELDQGSNSWEMSGGISTILSLGADGWLALAAGPGYPGASPRPDTIGLLQIPPTMSALRQTALTELVPLFEGGTQVGEQEVSRYQWNWLYLPEPDPALGRPKRVGMAAMAYFDKRGENSPRMLVGWSPSIAFQGIAQEYVVSELDRDGRLRGQAYRLKSAGWGEDNRWVTMPNSGCVVFPFAWVGDAPGRDFPYERDGHQASSYPRTLHMTSLCPSSASQPALTPTPAAQTDRERWPRAQ